MGNERKCLLKMTHNSLIVANTGQPFSRLGVISICASYRGTKREDQPADLFKEQADEKLPQAIREKEIGTYLWDTNRLFDDYNAEKEVSYDYGGRFLWELLQNADDAMSPLGTPPSNLIGIKGLGFKSVLEVTKKPEIFSDSFYFHFSSNETQELLKERGVIEAPPLTFRIPHDNRLDEEISNLMNEYPTIIRLPFKDEIAKKKVENGLSNLSLFFLLLSQYIKNVEVVWPDGRKRLWTIIRENDGELEDGDISVEAIEDEIFQSPYRFRRWAHIWSPEGGGKRHSVAICLPLSTDDQVQTWESTFPLYSFFPTEEFLPFRALFHASFDLAQSRKHVRDPDNEDILNHFEMLLGRIVDEIPSKISLQAFFAKDEPNKETLSYTFWKRLESVLKQKEFISCIGEKKVAPAQAHLWEYDLGNVLRPDEIEVKEKSLVEADLLEDEGLRRALELLGAEPLEKEMYPILLRYCKNKGKDDCQKALRVLFIIVKEHFKHIPYKNEKHYLENCRKVPCWWIADGTVRRLSDELPFLRKIPELRLPNWLQFDVLDQGFLECLNEIEKRDNEGSVPRAWDELLTDKLLQDTKDELLNHLLVPTIEIKTEKAWWEINGWDVLRLFETWTEDLKYIGKPLNIWGDEKRKRIGSSIHLPTDKGWLPAWKCYAGKAWDAPESFDDFFSKIDDRGVLKSPDQWPVFIRNNKDSWKRILRYAGVSWEMKLICRFVPEHIGWEINGYSGSWRIECPFPSLVREGDWDSYLDTLIPPSFNKRTQFDWDTKVHVQWAIEFFPEALPDQPLERLMAIKPIAKEAKNSKMRYTYLKGGGYIGRNTGQLMSFASWQIEEFPWLPCKKSLLDNRQSVPPSKAYMPGKGIGGLLPEIDIRIPDGQEGRDLATFLTQVLRIRETLPLSGEKIWKEWIEELPQAARRANEDSVAIKATRMLYRSFISIHDEMPEWIEEIDNIPCLTWDQEGKGEQLGFHSSSDIYWLDEPYLAEPNTRIELLRRFNIFILEQEQGKKAAEWFKISPLSDMVRVQPIHHGEDSKITHIVIDRYNARYKSLNAVAGSTILPKPSELKLIAVNNLHLKIMKEGKTISEPKVRKWRQNGKILLDKERHWEALGLALIEQQTRKGLSNLFENLLRARDGDEVLQRLRDLGVPEAALEDLESDFRGVVISESIETEAVTEESKEVQDRKVEALEKKDDGAEKSTPETHVGHEGTINSRGVISQSRREKGEDAENWMRSQLSDLLISSDWSVSRHAERDQMGRETDIVLSHPSHSKHHIEVKHVEAGEIFWSEREVSKAKDNKGKYWMAVVRPRYEEDDQNVMWLWDPLNDLQGLPKSGKWFWRKEIDELSIPNVGWDVPIPRKKEDATHFTFIISVSDDFLGNERFDASRGLECLKDKLDQISKINL